ncbi:MAG: hypothetical protein PHI35_05155 [Victivallaceae bacterium]|nr:hypothetical protein [Victivallaceae bacterium]
MTDNVNDSTISRRTAAFCVAALMLCTGVVASLRLLNGELQSRDACTYMLMAQDWATLALGGGCMAESVVPPGLIVVLRGFAACGIDPEFGTLVFNIVCGMLLTWAAYWLASAFFMGERKYALIAAFLCAFHPMLLRHCSDVLRESSFILLFTLSLGCMVMMIRSRAWRWRVAGLVAIMLTMSFRLEGVELMLFYVLAAVLGQHGDFRGEGWRRLCINGLMLTGALLIMFAFQLWWNSHGMDWQIVPLKRAVMSLGGGI